MGEETRTKVIEEESSSEDEHEAKGLKYQRLLQLEEEAELLNKKLEQKEVAMKNRDLKINELQAQLEDLTLQHARETKVVAQNNSLKLRNLEAEKEQMEESVNKYKEKAKKKKAELRVK